MRPTLGALCPLGERSSTGHSNYLPRGVLCDLDRRGASPRMIPAVATSPLVQADPPRTAGCGRLRPQ